MLRQNSDCDLSDLGMCQVNFERTCKAKDLAKIGAKPITTVYCSPLKRAIRTAFAFPNVQQIIIVPDLAEIRTNEGMNSTQLYQWIREQNMPEHLFKCRGMGSKDPWFRNMAKETKKNAQKRVCRALSYIYLKTKNNASAIVSHSNAINMMLGRHTYPFKKKNEKNSKLPKGWGSRGFPANFKPFKVAFKIGDSSIQLKPGNKLLLIRHAHSRNNKKK